MRLLPMVALGVSGSLAGCSDDINNYEKELGSEASNKVFFSEKYVSLNFEAQRSATGTVTNMDTLVAKLVVNCNAPAGNDFKVKMNLDTLLVDVYNSKNETDYIQFNTACIKLNRKELTIEEGNTESTDTLVVSLVKSLDAFSDTKGYILPIRITAASGYDAQVDYSRRISYLTLDVDQKNGIGFEKNNNTASVEGGADFTGYTFPLVTGYGVLAENADVSLEIANELVASFNATNGTDYQELPDVEVASVVSFPAGETTCPVELSYKGDASTLDGSYLVPVRVKSVSTVDVLPTHVYYIILNFTAAKLDFSNDAADLNGIRQEERSAYKAIADAKPSMMGEWENMFKGQQWVSKEKQSVIVDLGNEMKKVVGICIEAANMHMAPKSMEITYAGEDMFAANPNMSISLGTVECSGKYLYIFFPKPVVAGAIGLMYMTPNGSFYSFLNFYVYTEAPIRCTTDASVLSSVRQEERSAYKAIADAKPSAMGEWENMFKGQQLVSQQVQSVTVDLGSEVESITGIYIRAANNLTVPKSMEVTYAAENGMNAATSFGTVECVGPDMYIVFPRPVKARYLGLKDITPARGAFSFMNFFVYTKE